MTGSGPSFKLYISLYSSSRLQEALYKSPFRIVLATRDPSDQVDARGGVDECLDRGDESLEKRRFRPIQAKKRFTTQRHLWTLNPI